MERQDRNRSIVVAQTSKGWLSEHKLVHDSDDPCIEARCLDDGCALVRRVFFIQAPGRPVLEQAALAATIDGCRGCGGPVEAKIMGHGV